MPVGTESCLGTGTGPRYPDLVARWRAGCEDKSPAGSRHDDRQGQSHCGQTLVRLGNVSSPTITLYSPNGANTGAAIVVFPGGGYRILAIDLEGTEVCTWLNSAGHHVRASEISRAGFRTRIRKSAAALRMHSARSGWFARTRRSGTSIRTALAYWVFPQEHISPQRSVRILISDSMRPSMPPIEVSCRPDFAVIVYPGYLAIAEQNFAPNPEIHPTDKTPSSFILQAEDDPVHVENATTYFQLLATGQGSGGTAHLCGGWARIRLTPHCASRHRLAEIGRKVAGDD